MCSGLGCEFVMESCDNPETYPYLCDEAVIHQCTFDRISRVSVPVMYKHNIMTYALPSHYHSCRVAAKALTHFLMVVQLFWLMLKHLVSMG